MGIFATGQAYEQMLLRMTASPLPETRDFAAMMLTELKKVIPSFVARVERPDRGGEWIEYLRERREATERWVARLGLDRRSGPDRPSVELVHVDGDEEDLLASALFEQAGAAEEEIRVRIDALDGDERERLSPSWPASGATAATALGADGRRSATGSRSSPTTAASATFSATGC